MEPLHDGGEEDDPPERIDREARLRIRGFVEFADEGDGVLDASDTVVRSDLVRFGRTERTEADGAWFFSAQSEDGRLRVTTRVPMAPDASAPLVAWTVAAQHACGAGATHYAVLIDESDPAQDERFVPAECGADVWPRARRDLARSPFSPSG